MTTQETAPKAKPDLSSWSKREAKRSRQLNARRTRAIAEANKRKQPGPPLRRAQRTPQPPRQMRIGNPEGRTFDERHPNYVCAVRPHISQDEAGRMRISTRWNLPPAPSWETQRVLGGGTRRIVKQKHGRITGASGAHP